MFETILNIITVTIYICGILFIVELIIIILLWRSLNPHDEDIKPGHTDFKIVKLTYQYAKDKYRYIIKKKIWKLFWITLVDKNKHAYEFNSEEKAMEWLTMNVTGYY